MNYIGNSLRKLRKLYERKQDDIAGSLGISVRQYRKFENNQTPVKGKYIDKLASIYEIDPNEIVSFDESILKKRPENEFEELEVNNIFDYDKFRGFYEDVINAKNKLIKSQHEMILYLKAQLKNRKGMS